MKVRAWRNMEWEQVTRGLARKIITGEKVMSAQVHLEKGARVPEHAHANEQISHILEGSLKFWVAGEILVLGPGDVLVIPPDVPHGVLALEETLVLDVFSPIRQDWLDHTDGYLRATDTDD